MALNFIVSYTYSPSTTIASSQVNTNFSDIASVFQGLEAETKTLAKLKMDIDPTLALEVATKQYVDHYSTYRRPVLQYSSGTVVNIETGINGVSGQAQILFPDGVLRTDSTTTRINCNLAQVAALSGAAQSGLRTGTVTSQTWYAIYAVKTSDNSSNFVTVADTVLPLQANYSTLNSNFGTNSWVYLGLIRVGAGVGVDTTILKFIQAGSRTTLYNSNHLGNASFAKGLLLATTAGTTTTLTYAYSAGTSGAVIPNNITIVDWVAGTATSGALAIAFSSQATTDYFGTWFNGAGGNMQISFSNKAAVDGFVINRGSDSSRPADIFIDGFIDGVLGVGSNPIL